LYPDRPVYASCNHKISPVAEGTDGRTVQEKKLNSQTGGTENPGERENEDL